MAQPPRLAAESRPFQPTMVAPVLKPPMEKADLIARQAKNTQIRPLDAITNLA